MLPRYRLVIDGERRYIYEESPSWCAIKDFTSMVEVKAYFRDPDIRGKLEECRFLEYKRSGVFDKSFIPNVHSPDVTIDVEMQEFESSPFVLMRRIKGPTPSDLPFTDTFDSHMEKIVVGQTLSEPEVRIMNDSEPSPNTPPDSVFEFCKRQTASGAIRSKAAKLREIAARFDALAAKCDSLPPNSPEEEAMWELINAYKI